LNQWGLSGGLNGAFDQVDVLAGYLEVNLGSATSYTFGTTNYATTGNEHMYRAVKFSGSPSSGVTVNIPAVDDYKFVENATGQTITFSNGSTTATLANTFTGYIRTNGSSVITVLTLPDGVNVKTLADNIASVNQVATDSASVVAVAGKSTEIGRLGTTDAVADMALLGTTANVAAQALLATSANVTAQGHLGTSANVTAQGHLGTSANVAAQALIGTSANVAAQALIGTSANVAAQTLIGTSANIAIQALMGTTANIAAQALIGTTANVAAQALIGTTANVDAQALIGTSANITAQALLGTSANVAAQALIGTSANIAAQALIGTTANVNAQALIGTSANIAVQALLGTSANVAAMALLGTSSNVTNMANLGTSQNVTNMNTLSGISADITGVNSISANVTAVNTDPLKSNINTTAGAVTNVNSVGTNISSVNSVASNMASVNSFGNTYQISTNNPTTGGDGSSALANGMLAYVTSAQKLRAYNATSGAWEDAGSAVNGLREIYQYVATANQTVFPATGTIAYDQTAGGAAISIFLNGVLLKTTDYTATNGTSVTLASGAALNDEVTIHTFGAFNVSDTYSRSAADGLLAAKAPLASPTFTGTLASPTINASTALQIGGVAISASAAELNYNDVTTLGTTEASKTVTADANGVVTFDNGKIEESTAITSSSNAATINLRDGDNFTHTLSENVTYTFSNPAANGKVSAFTLKVTQDSTARTITWPTSVDWAAATAPTLSTDSGAIDVFVFTTYDGGTTYYGFAAGQAMG
jgi:UDP-3-O-[3-hydroxymyristoyl] glucosamine N-acyltransferase